MGVLYLFIIVIAVVIILVEMDFDTFAPVIGIIIAIPAVFWIVFPHYSYNTEIIDTKSYSLVELNEIDNEYFKDENTYLIYDSVNDDFIYYYKDEKGVIRQDSVSASSDFVSIVRNDSTILDINTRDYTSKALKHLLFNNFDSEYVLNIPENSEIYYLYPDFIDRRIK